MVISKKILNNWDSSAFDMTTMILLYSYVILMIWTYLPHNWMRKHFKIFSFTYPKNHKIPLIGNNGTKIVHFGFFLWKLSFGEKNEMLKILDDCATVNVMQQKSDEQT